MLKSYELTVQEYLNRERSQQGVCFRCDTWTLGIDPGAARQKCTACGESGVHGVDQALLLGLIQIRRP